MADLPAARKRLGDRFAHNAIDMCARVVADRLHFRRVGLAVRKRRLFNRAIEDGKQILPLHWPHSEYKPYFLLDSTLHTPMPNNGNGLCPVVRKSVLST